MNLNLLYIIIFIFALFFIIRFLNRSKLQKCTDCNVWNHVDVKTKCERLCKESNLNYSGKSTKINKDLHCECS